MFTILGWLMHPSLRIVTICVCVPVVGRTFKTYPLSNFKIHNTLTVVTRLYITYPELTHLITGSLEVCTL